jgi:hypothetical protein
MRPQSPNVEFSKKHALMLTAMCTVPFASTNFATHTTHGDVQFVWHVSVSFGVGACVVHVHDASVVVVYGASVVV